MAGQDQPLRKLWTFVRNHAIFTLLGLLVVLVPIVVIARSVEHAHKTVDKYAQKLAPKVGLLQHVAISGLAILGLFVACWFIGVLVANTGIGQRWLEWEKAKLLRRTPMLESHVVKWNKTEEEPPVPARPALVCVATAWRPGLIIAEESGICTAFVPELPQAMNGQLYCLPVTETLILDMSLDDFRKKLTGSGHGSQDWIRALAAAQQAG